MESSVGPGLVIAAAQPPCSPYDVGANALEHAAIVRGAEARVIAFPEMSLTGYELDAPPVDPGDERLTPIAQACSAVGAIALVGAPTRDAHGDHISVLAIDDGGCRVLYQKMWLSDTEAKRFSPGSEPCVLVVDGWHLGIAVCKDTGIEEHSNATAGLGMDAYVAGVLDSADDASVQESRAQRVAMQHGVWVVVASFAGSTGGGFEHAAAQSRIWGPDGQLVASAGMDAGRLARATLSHRPAPA